MQALRKQLRKAKDSYTRDKQGMLVKHQQELFIAKKLVRIACAHRSFVRLFVCSFVHSFTCSTLHVVHYTETGVRCSC